MDRSRTEPGECPDDVGIPTSRQEPISRKAKGVAHEVVTRWAFGVLILAALVLVVARFSDIAEVVTLARSAHPGWLLLAMFAQAGTYLCAGGVWREALKHAGRRLPITSMATLGLVKLFADQTVPSLGLSGTLVLLRGLARHAIPASMTMSALLVDVV